MFYLMFLILIYSGYRCYILRFVLFLTRFIAGT